MTHAPKGRRALSLRNPSNTRTGTESPISWTEFEVSAGHSDSTPVGSGGVLTQIPFTPELGAPPSFLLTFSNPVRNRQCLIQIKLGMAADIGREQNGFALAAAISVDLDQKVPRYASLLWGRRSQMISPPRIGLRVYFRLSDSRPNMESKNASVAPFCRIASGVDPFSLRSANRLSATGSRPTGSATDR